MAKEKKKKPIKETKTHDVWLRGDVYDRANVHRQELGMTWNEFFVWLKQESDKIERARKKERESFG